MDHYTTAWGFVSSTICVIIIKKNNLDHYTTIPQYLSSMKCVIIKKYKNLDYCNMKIITMSSTICVILGNFKNFGLLYHRLRYCVKHEMCHNAKKLGIVYVLKILSSPKYLKKLFLKLAQYVLLEHIPCHA